MKYFKQETGYTCACACMRMILSHYDIESWEIDLEKEMNTDEEYGTTTDDWKNYLDKIGFNYIDGNGSNLSQLEWLIDNGYLVVVTHIVEGGVSHCSIYNKHDEKYVYINDPAFGENKKHLIDDFMVMWAMDGLMPDLEFKQKYKYFLAIRK